MREKINKTSFIKNLLLRIEKRELLVKFYNEVYLPTLKRFDGKMYNKRFADALRDEIKARQDECLSVRFGEINNVCIIHNYHRPMSWGSYESLSIGCVVTNKRIDYSASISYPYNKWANDFIDSIDIMRDIVNNYDVYLAKCKEVQDAISSLKNIPFYMLENIKFYDTLNINL